MNSVCFLILFGISFRVNLAVEFPDLTSHYKEVLERKNSEFSYTGKSSNTVSKARQSIEKLKQFTDDPGYDKEPIYNICTAFLKEFGYRSSNFIQCSVENARPFRFCESCVVEYKRSMTTFEDILQDDSRWNGCRDVLLKADRIQVLDQVYNNIKNVWSQAFCDGCFEDGSITEDVNGTVSYVYSDTAKEFRYLFDNVTSCISSNSNISMVQQTDLSLNVCYACLPDFVALNKKFTDAMEKSSQAVCMDLVDMMNYTRITWGLTLQCTRTHQTNAMIIVITVGIAVLTVCFYVVLGIRGSKKEKKIMKQKRMSLRSAAALYGATLQVHQDGGDTNQDGLDDKDDKGVFG